MIGKETNGHKTNECSVVDSLLPLTTKKQELLSHPIINTFIMIKYNTYAVMIITLLLLRTVFCGAITVLALTSHFNAKKSTNEREENSTNILTKWTDELLQSIAEDRADGLDNLSLWMWMIFLFSVSILNAVFSGVNLFKFVKRSTFAADRVEIFFQSASITFNILVVIYLVVVMNNYKEMREKYEEYWTPIMVFFAWLSITFSLRFLMFGALHNLGLYIRMLVPIFEKVTLFITLYLSLILGFAMSFNLLVNGKDAKEFANPFNIVKPFIKTIAMMTGEVEYSDLFGENKILANMFFFFFVIIGPIIINNLLIGLTVSDVNDLIESSNMDGLSFKLKEIAIMDNSVLVKIIEWVAKNLGWLAWKVRSCVGQTEKVWKQSGRMISDEANSMEVLMACFSQVLHVVIVIPGCPDA